MRGYLVNVSTSQHRSVSPGFFAVRLDNPPVNLIDPHVFGGLLAVKAFAEDPARAESASPSLPSSEAGQAIIGRITAKAGDLPFDHAVELDLPRLCDPD